jgi:uncharacterized protein
MIQDLEKLITLQEIDLRIREQELAQEQFPSEVKSLEQGIEKVKTALANANVRRDQAVKDIKDLEEQVQKAKEGLDKSQERLNSIKTNREYDAVHAEIESQKSIMNNAEHRRKALDEEIQKVSKVVEEATAELEKVKNENGPKIDDLKQKIGTIDSNIATITKERETVLPSISKAVLRTYDLIRKKRKNGRAVSLVTSSHTCAVCYKVLEPQLLNDIRRGNKTILCQNCGSIMIWNEPKKEDTTQKTAE